MRVVYSLLIQFAICVSIANGAERIFHVSVHVESSNDTESVLESNLLAELRKHSDVSVVTVDPDYTLSVVCLKSRDETSLACSCVGIRIYSNLDVIAVVDPSLKKDPIWQVLQEEMKGAGHLVAQDIITTGILRIDSMASGIASSFDTEALEPVRKADANLKHRLEKFPKNQQH